MSGYQYTWIPSTGGDVGDASNWLPTPDGPLPGGTDEAVFQNLGGTITGTITVGQWVIDAGADYYTFAGNTTLSATALFLAASAGASGTLDVSSGATANVSGAVVVGNGGSSAIVDIDAATMTAQAQVQVGLQSSGTLIVQDGGLLSTTASLAGPFLGAGGAGNTGSVVVSGAGSELDAGANQVEIGAGGSGALTVEGGASLMTASLFIAVGGTATVDLAGARTMATIGGTGGICVGQGGAGTLETHDVLLANGAPAESYRDDGNRWLVQNANSGWQLPPQEPCAPVLTGGPIMDAIWRRLLDGAGPRPG